ncbi:hypothetical protein JCM10213v2_002696 [Rhodosporidiobolus nylandii]
MPAVSKHPKLASASVCMVAQSPSGEDGGSTTTGSATDGRRLEGRTAKGQWPAAGCYFHAPPQQLFPSQLEQEEPYKEVQLARRSAWTETSASACDPLYSSNLAALELLDAERHAVGFSTAGGCPRRRRRTARRRQRQDREKQEKGREDQDRKRERHEAHDEEDRRTEQDDELPKNTQKSLAVHVQAPVQNVVVVETSTGKEINLIAPSSVTAVKEGISALEGIPAQQQCLLHKGQTINDSLLSHVSETGGALHLVLRLRGGASRHGIPLLSLAGGGTRGDGNCGYRAVLQQSSIEATNGSLRPDDLESETTGVRRLRQLAAAYLRDIVPQDPELTSRVCDLAAIDGSYSDEEGFNDGRLSVTSVADLAAHIAEMGRFAHYLDLVLLASMMQEPVHVLSLFRTTLHRRTHLPIPDFPASYCYPAHLRRSTGKPIIILYDDSAKHFSSVLEEPPFDIYSPYLSLQHVDVQPRSLEPSTFHPWLGHGQAWDGAVPTAVGDAYSKATDYKLVEDDEHAAKIIQEAEAAEAAEAAQAAELEMAGEGEDAMREQDYGEFGVFDITASSDHASPPSPDIALADDSGVTGDWHEAPAQP